MNFTVTLTLWFFLFDGNINVCHVSVMIYEMLENQI